MTLKHQDGLKSSIEALSRPRDVKHYPRDNQARSLAKWGIGIIGGVSLSWLTQEERLAGTIYPLRIALMQADMEWYGHES